MVSMGSMPVFKLRFAGPHIVKAAKRNFALKTITSMCSCLKSGASFLNMDAGDVRLVGAAVSHFDKDEVVQESLFDTAPSMWPPRMNKVVPRSRRSMRKLAGAFQKRPLK